MVDHYGGWLDPHEVAAIRRRSLRFSYALTVLVIAVGWTLGGVVVGRGFDPVEMVFAIGGVSVGISLRARSEGQPWESGTPRSLVLGLSIRQQMNVWRAVWTGRPSADLTLRTVELVTVRRALGPSRTSTVGLTAVVAVVFLAVGVVPIVPTGVRLGSVLTAVVVVALGAFDLRTVRGAREYAGRLGVVASGSLAGWATAGRSPAAHMPSRFVKLWSPDGPEHRKWFRRTLLTFLATVVCGGAGLGLLLLSSALPSGGDDPAVGVLLPALVLFFLGMVGELVVIVTLLAGLWTYVSFRRSSG